MMFYLLSPAGHHQSVTSSPPGLLNTCSDLRQLSAALKLTGKREYLHETQQLQFGLESDIH